MASRSAHRHGTWRAITVEKLRLRVTWRKSANFTFTVTVRPKAWCLSDIETVRKTIKRVGEELLDDPEIGAEFMQPLKMQGVVDVLQTALVVRCKFTATPSRPTYLQRQALRRLIDAFAAHQI